MTRIDLPPRPRILVIALRRLGDVLLTTLLIRSLRRAWPHAVIEALVFSDTAAILEGNPDLNGIVTMPVRPGATKTLATAVRLWRKYDLAISTQSGDRPIGFADAGVRRKDGIFATGVIHFWHPEAERSQLARNEDKLADVLAGNRVRALRGLSSLQGTSTTSVRAT